MKQTERQRRANELVERGSKLADRGTKQGREQAARLNAQANAVKRGRPTPSYARELK